jgi:hypothetical protein
LNAVLLSLPLLCACSEDERKKLGASLAAPAGISGEEWQRCEEKWSTIPKESLGRFGFTYFQGKMVDAPPATHERLRRLTATQFAQDVREAMSDERQRGCFYWLMMSYCGTYQIMNASRNEPEAPGFYIHMREREGAHEAEMAMRAAQAATFLRAMEATTANYCFGVSEDAPVFYLAHIIGRNGQWWKTYMGGDGLVCPVPFKKTG